MPATMMHARASGRAAGRGATDFARARRGPNVRPLPRRQRVRVRAEVSGSESAERITPDVALSKPLFAEEGDAASTWWVPDETGVYAVFDQDNKLQYVGLSQKMSSALKRHAQTIGRDRMVRVADTSRPTRPVDVRMRKRLKPSPLTPHSQPPTPAQYAAQVLSMPGASKAALQAVWQEWVQDHYNKTGEVPVGNMPGPGSWSVKRQGAPGSPPPGGKADLKLTPGKGEADLSVSVSDLIDSLVKTAPVVAFIKGSRHAPECGFSHAVVGALVGAIGHAGFESVNVLDERYNPGVREAVKQYAQWPTIPQVYVKGEFIGGADIIQELEAAGELATRLNPKP